MQKLIQIGPVFQTSCCSFVCFDGLETWTASADSADARDVRTSVDVDAVDAKDAKVQGEQNRTGIDAMFFHNNLRPEDCMQ